MLTAIMMIECAPECAEDIAEASCHVAGVCESYVTGAEKCRVIVVARIPDAAMSQGIAERLSAIEGVENLQSLEVISARAADELSRIRENYE